MCGGERENVELWVEYACKTITVTHLWYALQGTIETPIAMMLRVIDACIGHLRHWRQQYAHRSARETKREEGELVREKLKT